MLTVSIDKLRGRFYLMVAVLAVTAFIPTLKTGFMWDDHVMIEANPALRSWSAQNLKHDFTSDVFDHHGDPYYRPMQTIANRVDYTIWGLHAIGFHLTNLLFHIGNALLTMELILALGYLPLTALLAGCLFAVHPIVVEQLMIIAGRAELMGLFFLLAAILLFLRNTRRSAIAAWLAYVLALLCKETGVLLPFALALVYYARQEPRTAYKRLVPLTLVILPYLWIRHLAVGPIMIHPDYWLAVRFFIQEFPHVLVRYLRLLLIPWNLHSHRLLPHLSHFWALYLIGVSAACGFLIRRFGRPAVFCIGWFLLMLLPKTPIMIYGNFMLEHWAYPAELAVMLPLALAVTWSWHSQKEWLRGIVALIYFFLLITWALLVHLNVSLRGTDEKMYRWALHFTTSNPVKYNLGVLLLQTGRPEEAANYLEDFRAYYPDDPDSARALALSYWQSGHQRSAIHILEDFDHQHPHNAIIENLLHSMKNAKPAS